MTKLTGPELMEKIVNMPTLDVFLDRDPHAQPYTDDELRLRVEGLRYERTQFLMREERAKMKKQGIETDKEDE